MKRYRPLLRLSTALRRGFNCYARNPQAMAIRTGLSVTIAGCLIEVLKDSDSMTATVVVSGDPNKNDAVRSAVKVAADLLVGRAKRTLGEQWRVVPWVQKRPVPGPTAANDTGVV